jgi:serine/threonine protein kinase
MSDLIQDFRCVYCGAFHAAGLNHCPETRRILYDAHKQALRTVEDDLLVRDFLGEGEWSVVYACEHLPTRKTLAIKFLKIDLRSFVEARDAFEQLKREARATAFIGHQGIAEVRRIGSLRSGVPFVVMELLTGITLAGLRSTWGRIPLTDACDIMAQVLGALEAAHGHGIAHWNLRPENIFLASPGPGPAAVKITDFGIARIAWGVELYLTTSQPGYVPPVPCYISPEQAAGLEAIDHRADLFSAGVILYELVTGHRPFFARSYGKQLIETIRAPVPDPRSHVPDLPPSALGFFETSLAKDPDERFHSAKEMLRELHALRRDAEPFAAEDDDDTLRIDVRGPVATEVAAPRHRDFSGSKRVRLPSRTRNERPAGIKTPPEGKKPPRRHDEPRTPEPFMWH